MHLWLDEAMEGPNPASILRNSVVVTAGALVLFKVMPLLRLSPLAITVLLVVGAGALALFPCYYSFVQELSAAHVGRLTGLLSLWVWAVTSPMHSFFGMLVDRTGSYDAGLVVAGLAPWLGVVAMKLFWRRNEPPVMV
jgi:ACS family hexuronate transporter-like MFS transporter